MYDNIASLRFDVGNNGETVVGAMVSAEGEVMEFRNPVSVKGRMEDWMLSVLEEMRATNRFITKKAIFYYCKDGSRYVSIQSEVDIGFADICVQTDHSKSVLSVLYRVDWMLLYQGMTVLAANQVWWTWEVEEVFKKVKNGDKHALKNYAGKMHRQIDELVTRITQPLKKNDRRKLNTVLILDVHARDIVDSFVNNR